MIKTKGMWAAALLTAGALSATQAAAGQKYNFTYEGVDSQTSQTVVATGWLDTMDLGGGKSVAVDGSMDINGVNASESPFTLIQTPGNSGNVTLSPLQSFNYDDLVYPGAPAGQTLTYSGLLFGHDDVEVNIWTQDPGYWCWSSKGTTNWNMTCSGGKFTLTAVPEPFTMALCAAGLGLAFARRRRSKSA